MPIVSTSATRKTAELPVASPLGGEVVGIALINSTLNFEFGLIREKPSESGLFF